MPNFQFNKEKEGKLTRNWASKCCRFPSANLNNDRNGQKQKKRQTDTHTHTHTHRAGMEICLISFHWNWEISPKNEIREREMKRNGGSWMRAHVQMTTQGTKWRRSSHFTERPFSFTMGRPSERRCHEPVRISPAHRPFMNELGQGKALECPWHLAGAGGGAPSHPSSSERWSQDRSIQTSSERFDNYDENSIGPLF